MLIVGGDIQAEVQPQKGLVGLSTCNTPFHNSEEALDARESQIDFVMVRQCLADAKAKAVKVGPRQ